MAAAAVQNGAPAPLQVDPASKNIAWSNAFVVTTKIVIPGISNGVGKIATGLAARLGLEKTSGFMARCCAWLPKPLDWAVRNGYFIDKNIQIHESAQRENPRRSRFMSWLTHPIKRMAFYVPWAITAGVFMTRAMASGNPDRVAEDLSTAMNVSNAIALLPPLTNLYEVGKRSLRGLDECYQHATATTWEKIKTASVYLGNLACEIEAVAWQARAFEFFVDAWKEGAYLLAEGEKVQVEIKEKVVQEQTQALEKTKQLAEALKAETLNNETRRLGQQVIDRSVYLSNRRLGGPVAFAETPGLPANFSESVNATAAS